MKKFVFPILLSTIWISVSEFVRNEFLLKSYWTDHYEKKGLIFPDDHVNGALWGVWSLTLAVLLFVIRRKFNFLSTVIIGWLSGFIMMWLVIGNLGVLPYGLLWIAIPLSMLEVIVATVIISQFKPFSEISNR